MTGKQVNIRINATDHASAVFKRLGRESDLLRNRLSGVGGSLSSLATGVGLGGLATGFGAVLGFGTAIRQAGDFEYALYQTTKVTKQSTQEIRNQLLALPTSLGSATELTSGYYQVLSAGVTDAAAAQETLITASKLAAVAEVTQGDAIRALTKMMTGYRGEIKKTSDAADLLMDMEQLGQTSVKELIPVIGDLAGVSQLAGVHADELAASLSLLTQTAGSTPQAATQYRALIMELVKPSEQMRKLIASLGAGTGSELISRNGFAGALSLIEEAAKQSGQELSRFVGSVEALTALSALGSGGFSKYRDMLAQVGKEAGRTEESFKKYQETFRGIESRATSTLTNIATTLGNGFVPAVKDSLNELDAYMQANSGQVQQWGNEAGEAFASVTRSIGTLVSVCLSLPEGIAGPAGTGLITWLLFGRTPAGAIIGSLTALSASMESLNRSFDVHLPSFSDIGRSYQESVKSFQSIYDVISGKRDYSTGELKTLTSAESEKSTANVVPTSPQPPASMVQTTPAQQENVPPVSPLPQLPKTFKPVLFADTSPDKLAPQSSQIAAALGRATDTGQEGDARLAALRKEYEGFARSLGTGNPLVRQFGEVLAFANQHLGYTPAEVAKATRAVEDEIRSLEASQAAMAAATRPDGTIDQRRLEQARAMAEAEQAYQADVLRGADASSAARKRELTVQQRQLDATREQAELVQGFYQNYGQLLDNHTTLAEQAIERELELYEGLISARELDAVRQRRLLDVSRSGWSGMQRALIDYYDEATNAGKNFESFFTNSFSGLEDALVQFTQTGKLSVSDMVNSMLADLARIAIRQSVTGPLAQGLSGLFSGLLGGGVAQAGDFDFIGPVQQFHTGGLVGRDGSSFGSAVPRSVFAHAPRFHSGGGVFRPDEYPAVLQTGERVLNRAETAAYQAGLSGAGMSGPGLSGAGLPGLVRFPTPAAPAWTQPIVNVSIHADGGQTGQSNQSGAQATPNGTGGFDLEIWIAQAADRGMAGMAAKGKSQLVNYIDKTRSTGGNARSLYR